MSARGEGFIKLDDDREVEILFTNRALIKFERRTKKAIFGVMQGFVDGTSGMDDLTALLREGMDAAQRARGNQKAVPTSQAIQVLEQAGFTKTAQIVMEAVSAVLSYGAEDDEAEGLPANEPDDDLDDLDLGGDLPKNYERSALDR